jgi:uncharacterized protein (DUF2252 family)
MNKNRDRSPRPRDREAILKKLQSLKMACSAHAYVRGTPEKFYEWLASGKHGRPEGPSIWICGDCHLGNLGPIADADGHVAIHIRDFDQAVIGNPTDDLIRLGLSLAMAARGSDLSGVATAEMMEQMIEGYGAALKERDTGRNREKKRPESVRIVMRKAVDRTWKQLAKERIEDARPTIPLGKRFWGLSKEEQREISKLFKTEKLCGLLQTRKKDAEVEVLDAAYWVKGCSSLGRLRFAVLLGLGGDYKEEGGLCLMDVKEAVRGVAPRSAPTKMPRAHAERVVEGARNLAPSLGERMLPARVLESPVFVRELLPQDLKIDIDRLTRDEAMLAARYLASVVGKAHARQMDARERYRWQKELNRNRSRNLRAPSWLWNSVVDLVSSHESAYLEHCRRYAMGQAL